MKANPIPSLLALMAFVSTMALNKNAISVRAEGESSEPEYSSVVSSEEPVSSETTVESEITVESTAISNDYVCSFSNVKIGFRDSEDVSYAEGKEEAIGSYYLSADGWKEGDDFDITMTCNGNVTTKLDEKVLYVYQYKPTQVVWLNSVVEQNEDKTFTLKKPVEPGEYALEIDFTKTMITNPADLTSINWSSLLTVQNLMTIGSWAVIVVGIIVLYALNRKYKTRGSTTLDSVKTALTTEIESVYGKTFSDQVANLFDTTVKTTFTAIDDKLSKVDNNQTILVRCLLAMQENTPESRLAVTELLTKLDTAQDEETARVKALIESEIQKRDEQKQEAAAALEEAKKANEAWKDNASDATSTTSEGSSGEGYDGTTI